MPDGELVEIADGVWAWIQPDGTWWVNNAGLIAGGEGDILVDTCASEARTRALLAAAAQARPGARIRYAINTHAHGDHSYGNGFLPPDAVILGHERMRATLQADPVIDGCPPFWTPVPDWGAVTRRLPDLVVAESAAIVSGSVRAEVRHPGYPAHTTGDLVVWMPEERILFAGDLLFSGLTPLVFMGSVVGARDALDWIASFAPRLIVPGHGPVLEGAGIADEIERHKRYYDVVLAAGRAALESGATPLEAATGLDLGEFAQWPDAERIVLNLHRVVADAHGTELDPIAAFRDAVAYNGGPMRTSL